MTRFAWLQTRTQTLTVTAIIGALAIAAAVTGVQLSHLYNTDVAHCQTGCDFAVGSFLQHYTFLQQTLDILARAVPALLGLFWGAPLLARELEAGTYRLAWTQSISRSRWLLTKLGLGALATVVVAGALTLTITWWYRAIDHINLNQYNLFDRRDVVPIGYAFFAFAAGALLGAVIRRVVPAMAATLALFVFARVAIQTWVRPHLLAPLHKTVSVLSGGGFGFESSNGAPVTLVAKGAAGPNTWTVSNQIVFNSSGHVATAAQRAAWVQQNCPVIAHPPPFNGPAVNHPVKAPPGVAAAFESCRQQAAGAFHIVVGYQPADRYWSFQWLELSLFVVLGLLALAGCYWLIGRRTA
jgi:ABC-2 family transporter